MISFEPTVDSPERIVDYGESELEICHDSVDSAVFKAVSEGKERGKIGAADTDIPSTTVSTWCLLFVPSASRRSNMTPCLTCPPARHRPKQNSNKKLY